MVLNGIDCIKEYLPKLRRKRLGLITSPTGLTRNFVPTIDILHKHCTLTALFSPEHGVRGEFGAGAMVETYTDADTGIPVYSLYRKDSKRLSDEMLGKVDAVVYDIQDVGTRYYTFISTLLYALEDCAKAGKELIVLDRINPLNGITIEGGILKEECHSFVGAYPLTARYGLTAGELAKMAAKQQKLDVALTVIPCKNWERTMLFPDTGLSWVMPSLGIPTFETALLYPGTCLFEGTNLSEGRGTTAPFHIIGAPFIHAKALADAMNALKISGVFFRPVYFQPTASKFSGEHCGGVYIHITDRNAVRSMEVGVRLLFKIKELYPEHFAFLPPRAEGGRAFIDLLSGGDSLRKADGADSVLAAFEAQSKSFSAVKSEFHLY